MVWNFLKTPRQREFEAAQTRLKLTRRVQKLLDKWQPILGVKIRELHIKKMRAFATLNPEDRRLWIGLAGANLSDAALEYVVVHELAHLRLNEGPEGSGHDDRFYAILDRYLPTWRRRHAGLYNEGVVARKLPGM